MRALLWLIAALMLLGACESSDDGVPDEPWMEAASYSYTVNSACGERWFIGTFAVTVTDHEVADAVAIDSDAHALLDQAGLEHIPTLDELVAEYRSAVDGNAEQAAIEHAPGDGHPTLIEIDWSSGIDDEACYTITSYDVSP